MSDETQSVDILGLFFGQYNTAQGETDPSTDLVIKKDDFNRSTGNIVGRFAWTNTGGYTEAIVTQVTVDGVPVKTVFGGGNVTTQGQNGTIDTPLFIYPNTAKALATNVKHVVKVTPGVRHGVLGGDHTFGIGFPSTDWFPIKTFSVTFV